MQAFEASEVNYYKCENCLSTKENNWKLKKIIYHHDEIGGWESYCKTCGEPAIIFND